MGNLRFTRRLYLHAICNSFNLLMNECSLAGFFALQLHTEETYRQREPTLFRIASCRLIFIKQMNDIVVDD